MKEADCNFVAQKKQDDFCSQTSTIERKQSSKLKKQAVESRRALAAKEAPQRAKEAAQPAKEARDRFARQREACDVARALPRAP